MYGTCMVKACCHDICSLCPLQVVPLSSVLEYRDTARAESLRSLALSVYTQCRRQVSPAVSGRSLTGFGPAAAAWERLLKPEVRVRAALTAPPLHQSRPYPTPGRDCSNQSYVWLTVVLLLVVQQKSND